MINCICYFVDNFRMLVIHEPQRVHAAVRGGVGAELAQQHAVLLLYRRYVQYERYRQVRPEHVCDAKYSGYSK